MNTLRVFALAALISISGTSVGEEPTGSNVGANLPPKVRALLIQEMNAVLVATQAILDGLVRGSDELVAENAQGIHDSFILQQEMTDADRKSLMDAVPDDFLEQDRAFHELSARLATAAHSGDKDRQRQLFANMVEACAGCHSQYAAGRFPGFGEEN